MGGAATSRRWSAVKSNGLSGATRRDGAIRFPGIGTVSCLFSGLLHSAAAGRTVVTWPIITGRPDKRGFPYGERGGSTVATTASTGLASPRRPVRCRD